MYYYKQRDLTKTTTDPSSINTKYLSFTNKGISQVVGITDTGKFDTLKVKLRNPELKNFNQVTLREFSFENKIPTIITLYNDMIGYYNPAYPSSYGDALAQGVYTIDTLKTRINQYLTNNLKPSWGGTDVFFDIDPVSKKCMFYGPTGLDGAYIANSSATIGSLLKMLGFNNEIEYFVLSSLIAHINVFSSSCVEAPVLNFCVFVN